MGAVDDTVPMLISAIHLIEEISEVINEISPLYWTEYVLCNIN